MAFYLCFTLLTVLVQPALCLYNCSAEYERIPDNSDINVDCGAQTIYLEINLCTAQWAGFNETNLALNSAHDVDECYGTVDTTVSPKVIRFSLPFNSSQGNPCRQSLQIVDEAPGANSAFSNLMGVQTAIITGFIDTPRTDFGIISYSTDLYYNFVCRYPLEYLMNNTEIAASSVSVATDINNGTFIDNLVMGIFNDSDYTYTLWVPATGLPLRTGIFVEVRAVNLTGNFNVMLDQCFATPNAYNFTQQEQYDFFVGCDVAPLTNVTENGVSAVSRFNYDAFRFMEHRDEAKSRMFLHCLVRLCEPDYCEALLATCNSRRKRSANGFGGESDESAMVSAGPIYIASDPQTDGVQVTGPRAGVVFASAIAVLLVLSSS